MVGLYTATAERLKKNLLKQILFQKGGREIASWFKEQSIYCKIIPQGKEISINTDDTGRKNGSVSTQKYIW